MRVLIAAILTTAVLLAGCAHEDRAGPEQYRLGGVLSEDFGEEDQHDLMRRADQRGAEVSLMESFPLQFDIRPLIISECENLRLELQQVDYVTTIDDCRWLP